MTVYEKLLAVQCELKAPKGQFNKFGGYKYRSCEDILEAVKPLLKKHKSTVFINDEIKIIGERYYVESTVYFVDVESGETVKTVALAREEESKKGMDGSQVTGASSSYARKYALNGMFDIDDSKDSDSTNTHGKEEEKPAEKPAIKPQNEPVNYRQQYIALCMQKGIDSIAYAKEHGINKSTTQEQYKAICEALENQTVSMDEI